MFTCNIETFGKLFDHACKLLAFDPACSFEFSTDTQAAITAEYFEDKGIETAVLNVGIGCCVQQQIITIEMMCEEKACMPVKHRLYEEIEHLAVLVSTPEHRLNYTQKFDVLFAVDTEGSVHLIDDGFLRALGDGARAEYSKSSLRGQYFKVHLGENEISSMYMIDEAQEFSNPSFMLYCARIELSVELESINLVLPEQSQV